MLSWISLVLVVVMLTSAVLVLTLQNLIGALTAAGVVSLALSLLFVIVRAPDVALTEAAVGAGLSGLVLALGLRRLGLWRLERDRGTAHALVSTAEREKSDA